MNASHPPDGNSVSATADPSINKPLLPSASCRHQSAGDCSRPADEHRSDSRLRQQQQQQRSHHRTKADSRDFDETCDDNDTDDDTDEERQMVQNVRKLSEVRRSTRFQRQCDPPSAAVVEVTRRHQSPREQRSNNGASSIAVAAASVDGCNRQSSELVAATADAPGNVEPGQPLTVEDVYIEAMTLDAEIRLSRRSLDSEDQEELRRIIGWCRDTLHRKLLLRSTEVAHGANSEVAAAAAGTPKGSVGNNRLQAASDSSLPHATMARARRGSVTETSV